MMNRRRWPTDRLANRLGSAMLFLIASSVAFGHSNEHLATQRGEHGGVLQMDGMYHFELLVKDGEIGVWVTDHGNTPQDTSRATGHALVVAGTQRLNVKLSPAGGNKLVGQCEKIDEKNRFGVVLTVNMEGTQPHKARFAVAPTAATATANHDRSH